MKHLIKSVGGIWVCIDGGYQYAGETPREAFYSAKQWACIDNNSTAALKKLERSFAIIAYSAFIAAMALLALDIFWMQS